MTFAYTKKLNYSFLEALDEVRIAFAEKWYGVVSNINIWEKIRANVDPEFKEYVVFWLCKPELAYKFLKEDMTLGVFMPCSVAIYQKPNDGVYVSAWLASPMITDVTTSDKIEDCAMEATVMFKKVIDSL